MLNLLLKGISANILLLFLNIVNRIFLSSLLIQIWGVKGFELWSLALAISGMVTILDFGVSAFFNNKMMASVAKKDEMAFTHYVSYAFSSGLLLALIGLIILLSIQFIFGWASILNIPETLTKDSLNLYTLAVPTIWFLAGAELIKIVFFYLPHIYRARGLFARGVFCSALFSFLNILAISLGSLFDTPLIYSALFVFFVTACYTLIVLPFDQRKCGILVKTKPKFPQIKTITKIPKKLGWYTVQHIAPLTLLHIPVLIINSTINNAGILAAFVLSRTVANLIGSITQSITHVFGVEFSSLLIKNENTQLIYHYKRALKFISVLSGCAFAAIIILSEEFFSIWTRGSVEVNFSILVPLTLAVMLSSTIILGNSLLLYSDIPKPVALSRISNAIITMVLMTVLGPQFGAIGIVYALFIGEVFGAGVITLPIIAKKIAVPFYSLITLSIFYTTAGCIIVSLSNLILINSISSFPLINFLLNLLIVASVSTLCIFTIGLDKKTRSSITSVAKLKLNFFVER